MSNNSIEEIEIDVLKIWGEVRSRIAGRFPLVLGGVLIFGLAGFLLSKAVSPQWEATALVRVGETECDDAEMFSPRFIEPPETLIAAIGSAGFLEKVFARSGIPADSPDAAVYKKTVSASRSRYRGVVSVKCRALSMEAVARLSSATVSEILERHEEMRLQGLNGVKKRLDMIQAYKKRLSAAERNYARLSPGDQTVAGLMAAHFLHVTDCDELDILEKVQCSERHKSVSRGIDVPTSPVFPRAGKLALVCGVIGLILSLFVAGYLPK